MPLITDPVSTVVGVVGGLLDKLIPDQGARDAAKLELVKAEQAGQLDAVKVQLSAIISDSQSADPWTSRARPSFLYVVYVLLLAGLPIGVLSAFRPDMASAIAAGFGMWLKAIPDSIVTLFGVVMTGYVGARSYEKAKGVA